MLGKSKLAQSLWYYFPVSTLQGAATDCKHPKEKAITQHQVQLGFSPFSMKSPAVLLPASGPSPQVGAGRSARIAGELLGKRENKYRETSTENALLLCTTWLKSMVLQDRDQFLPFKQAKNEQKNLKIKILSLQVSLPSFPPSPKKHFLLQTVFSFLRVQKLECHGNTYKREGISSCTLHYKEVCSQT